MADAASLARFREALGPSGVLCKLRAEIPTLGVPNWIAMLMGVRPEVHGLLGNRGPAEQPYSSLLSVAKALSVPSTLIGTPWFVDLARSQLAPLKYRPAGQAANPPPHSAAASQKPPTAQASQTVCPN